MTGHSPRQTPDVPISSTKRLVPLLLPETAAELAFARQNESDGSTQRQQVYAAPQAERREVLFVLPGSRRAAQQNTEKVSVNLHWTKQPFLDPTMLEERWNKQQEEKKQEQQQQQQQQQQ